MTEPIQQKIDEFLRRVYARGGAVSFTGDGEAYRVCMMSIPGIITKFETLEDAIERLTKWESKHEIT